MSHEHTAECNHSEETLTLEQARRLEQLCLTLQQHAFSLPEKYNGLELTRACLAIAVGMCKSTGVSMDSFLVLVGDAVEMTVPLGSLVEERSDGSS